MFKKSVFTMFLFLFLMLGNASNAQLGPLYPPLPPDPDGGGGGCYPEYFSQVTWDSCTVEENGFFFPGWYPIYWMCLGGQWRVLSHGACQ